MVTVRKRGADGFDSGSALVTARHDGRFAGVEPSLAALRSAVGEIGETVASLGTRVEAVSGKADEAIAATNRLFSFTARLMRRGFRSQRPWQHSGDR